MGIFQNNDGGVMDVIRCDEHDYLVWKWHPQGTSSQNSKRANSIRWGSSLRVREGSVAILVYPQENGTLQDFIVGPFDGMIETKNFPGLASIIGKFFQGGSPFQAEIYFINVANIIQIQFGVPYFDVFDPRFREYGVPVAVRGTLNFRIEDCKEFIKLHSLVEFDLNNFKEQIKSSIDKIVKSTVMQIPDKLGFPVVQIERNIAEISELIEVELREKLKNEYAVTVSSVDISDIEVNKDTPEYKKLLSLTQNKANEWVQGAVNIIGSLNSQIKGEKKLSMTESDNVGKKQKVTDAIGGLLGKKNKVVPPPIPTIGFYVAVDGKQKGPYDISKLKKMISDGTFDSESLVWKEGMEDWAKASEISELETLFKTTPPPISEE